MLTDVTFAKKNEELLLAYTNAKKQYVFLHIVRANVAPLLQNVLITDNVIGMNDIINSYLGYDIYRQKQVEIGVKISQIWKPFMFGDMGKELHFDVYDLSRAKRDLSILIQKLQDVLLYVEPSETGLQTYSHKIRELLIVACTEFECAIKQYHYGDNDRTSDYVKILKDVDLTKYQIEMAGYSKPFVIRPFAGWNAKQPTQSLPWYNAYTQIKHNMTDAFYLATLKNCIDAVAANLVMFAVRYDARSLYRSTDMCSVLVNNTFALQLENPTIEDMYIPIFVGERSYGGAFSVPFKCSNGKVIQNIFDIQTQEPFIEKQRETK